MGKQESYIAKTFQGLEEVLAEELHELGAKDVNPIRRAVSFKGTQETLYRANLSLHTALSILKPINKFKARNEKALYAEVSKMNWGRIMSLHHTFAIDSFAHSSFFNHSQFIALKTKDAIVDQFRDRYGERPNVDRDNPDFRINVHVAEDQVTISLDSSGEALFKRGYRKEAGQAPLNEVLAAGLIKLSGWDGKTPFVDGMCGSGTIPIEASMIACDFPPNFGRWFSFKSWKDEDEQLLTTIKNEFKSKIHEAESPIYGAEKFASIVEIAEKNARIKQLPTPPIITQEDFFELEPPAESGTLIMNPPYGKRLQADDMNALYEQIGTALKHKWMGWKAWLFTSNVEALKFVGLKPFKKYDLYNGPLECKFWGYDLYTGSKKTVKKS